MSNSVELMESLFCQNNFKRKELSGKTFYCVQNKKTVQQLQ
jgi:hypothetical protein